MEYHELHEQLKSLEEQKAEIARALQAKRNDRKKELVAEFKARLKEEGFDFDEVCGSPGKGRSRRSGARNYPVYVAKDDADCVYVRGPLPGWMKDKMSALGLNPAAKADRDRYKTDYMVVKD